MVSDSQDLLDGLARSTGATAAVMLPDESRRHLEIPLYAIPPVPVRVNPRSLPTIPLHATAAGKCYLADLSEAELCQYMAPGLQRMTERTLHSPRALRQELAAVRRQGYALNREEVIIRAPGISVPLRVEGGRALGGLSLVHAEVDFDEAQLLEQLPLLREASARLAGLLSYESYRSYMREAAPGAPTPLPEGDDGRTDPGGSSEPPTRSFARAFRLMATLWESPEGESVSELARRRGIDRATAFRLLQSLAAEGMVRKDVASGRYFVDPLFWLRLAPVLREAAPLEKVIATVLERLARFSGATCILVQPDAGKRRAVVSARAIPEQPWAFHAESDMFPPLHTTAARKCLLAACAEPEVAAYIGAGLEALTEHTVTSPEALVRELKAVRELGHAVSREELLRGVGGLAVPVLDQNGQIVGALALAPPVSQFTKRNLEAWVRQLRIGAHALSRILAEAHAARGSREMR
jgi:DNA-binding IclR family transcriptional regulator